MASPDSAAGIYHRHRVRVFRYLVRSVGRMDLAQDLCQEVFLRVVRGLDTYHERQLEAAWVFQIARRVLAEHWREAPLSELPLDDPAAAVGEAAPVQLLRVSLTEALARLSPMNRELLLLREGAGLSHAEIAAATGLTVAGVKCRLGRTREWLQRTVVYERRVSARGASRGEGHET
jgi:RNA polymerase sigma-70 factor (ECF subfamily)